MSNAGGSSLRINTEAAAREAAAALELGGREQGVGSKEAQE